MDRKTEKKRKFCVKIVIARHYSNKNNNDMWTTNVPLNCVISPGRYNWLLRADNCCCCCCVRHLSLPCQVFGCSCLFCFSCFSSNKFCCPLLFLLSSSSSSSSIHEFSSSCDWCKCCCGGCCTNGWAQCRRWSCPAPTPPPLPKPPPPAIPLPAAYIKPERWIFFVIIKLHPEIVVYFFWPVNIFTHTNQCATPWFVVIIFAAMIQSPSQATNSTGSCTPTVVVLVAQHWILAEGMSTGCAQHKQRNCCCCRCWLSCRRGIPQKRWWKRYGCAIDGWMDWWSILMWWENL